MNSKLGYAGRTLIFLAIASCSRTAAAEDSGWYVGAGIGEVNYGSHGVLYVGSEKLDAQAIDDSDDPLSSSLSLAFGYRFNRYLSLEAGYMSNDSTTFALTDSAGEPFGTYEFGSEGSSVTVVGTLPLGNWELYAREGVLYARTKVRLVAGGETRWTDSVHTPEALGALGAAYNFTPNWQARLDYSYVVDAGERGETGHADVELPTLGFTYRF